MLSLNHTSADPLIIQDLRNDLTSWLATQLWIRRASLAQLNFSLVELMDISLISAQFMSRASVSDHSDHLPRAQESQLLFLPTKGSQLRMFGVGDGADEPLPPCFDRFISISFWDSTIRSLNDWVSSRFVERRQSWNTPGANIFRLGGETSSMGSHLPSKC